MSELKPCPFCDLHMETVEGRDDVIIHPIRTGCVLDGKIYTGQNEKWNRRAEPPSAQVYERAARLLESLKELEADMLAYMPCEDRVDEEPDDGDNVDILQYRKLRNALRDFGPWQARASLAQPAPVKYSLATQPAEDKRDAERYRWLRSGDNDEVVMVAYPKHTEMTPATFLPRLKELDAAIDAAMSANKKGE